MIQEILLRFVYFTKTKISPEISDYEVDLKEIVAARNKARKNLENQLHSGNNIAEELISSKQKELDNPVNKKDSKKSKIKRYYNE